MSYTHHVALAEALSKRRHWLLSLDDCTEARLVYSQFTTILARYCIGRHKRQPIKSELVATPGQPDALASLMYEVFLSP